MYDKKLITILLALLLATATYPAMISSTQFEDWKKGEPTSMLLFQDKGFKTGTWENSLKERTIIDTLQSASGTQSMRIMYPTGGVGPEETGCQIQLKFDKREEAYASYYLRFSENFTWGTTSYGGKLPGLSGGKCCSGGASCDGTNGFSARLMWRTGGKGVLYLYHMDKPATYGEDHDLIYPDGSHVIFERGKWYHVAERVKCNTDGSTYDGEVEIWIDGKQVLLLKGLRFTSNGDKVDDLYISTFHGGDDPTWAPTDTCYTWLDDIRIGTTYEDVAYQQCSKPELGDDPTLCTGAKSILLAPERISKNTKYTWIYENTVLSQEPSVNVWKPGSYTLIADSAWCSRRDTVKILNSLESYMEKERHICDQSFITLETHIKNHPEISFAWMKEGKDLEEKGNSLRIKDAGNYSVTISSPTCQSVTNNIHVTSGLLNIRDTFALEGEELTLHVDPEGVYDWYEEDLLPQNKPSATGNTWQTTIRANDRYIYVKDNSAYSGHVGKKELSQNAYTRSNFDTEWMLFTIKRELTIDSLSIYPVKNLTAVLRILDEATGQIVWTQTYEGLQPGENSLPINARLQPGRYRLDASGTTASLYHSYADDDIHFPYSIEGLIDIEGCNLAWINNKPWYLFFYNWKISAGNTCAATPVLLKRDITTTLRDPNNSRISVYPKFTDGDLFIEGLPDTAQVNIYSPTGKKMLSRKVKQPNVHFSIAEWKHGNYIIEIKTPDETYSVHILKF